MYKMGKSTDRIKGLLTAVCCTLFGILMTTLVVCCLACATSASGTTIAPKRTKKPLRDFNGALLCTAPELVFVPMFVATNYSDLVEEACRVWNFETGRKVLKYGGPVVVDPYDNEPRAFTLIAPATEEMLAEWDIEKHPEGRPVAGRASMWIILTKKHPSGNCIIGSHIWFRDDGEYTDDTLFHIILHELGHVLGLDDHHEETGIMRFEVAKNLTSRDYTLAPGTRKWLRKNYPVKGKRYEVK